MSTDDTIESIEATIGDTPVLFGLRAQGHIPTIEAMLKDGQSWQAIGIRIGWEPATARSWYERTIGDAASIAARGVLAEIVEILKDMKKLGYIRFGECYGSRISGLILAGERHLMSRSISKPFDAETEPNP